MDIRKDLNNLGLTANGTMVGPQWTDRDGNRYHVWLAVERPEGADHKSPNNGYVPVRPFRVSREYQRKTDQRDGKMLLYKNPPLNTDGSHKHRREPGYFDTRHMDAEASANAAVVTEALRRAEAEGMFEAAVAANQAKAAAEKAQRRAKAVAGIRQGLTDWLADDDVPAFEREVLERLLATDDDQLLRVADAINKGR